MPRVVLWSSCTKAGLSLLDPNSTNVPLLAGAAQQALGDDIDAFLLGNVSQLNPKYLIL